MKYLTLSILLYLLVYDLSGQTTINAGNDTTICYGNAASLHSTVTGGSYGTSSYTFEVYPYSPESYSGGTQVWFASNQDDQIAGPFNIGFNFCFFDQTYTQFYIGSNGWVGFSTNPSWTTYTATPIPNTDPAVPKNCIMAPWQDWWPNYSNPFSSNVRYYTTGSAPNRKLVVYWNACPMYQCTTTYGTFQIVLNEQNSIVENHLTNKPYCGWNQNKATQGVHNADGTVAFTATGRNCTDWTATNESTRFVPAGVIWYAGGVPVGYGANITVAPAVTTTYTAVINTCGGGSASDSMIVTVADQRFDYASSTYCQNDPDPTPVMYTLGGIYTALPAGLVFQNNSTGIIDLSASLPGTYSIKYSLPPSCADSEYVTIVSSPAPPAAITPVVSRCNPGMVTFSVDQPAGVNINWYDAPTGGNLMPFTGGTVTTFAGVSTHYYAEAVTNGSSCKSVTRTDITINVYTEPVITNILLNDTICSSDSAIVILQSTVPGTTYTWTASSTSPNITGFSNGSGVSIRQKLVNSGATFEIVTYSVTPAAWGCVGNPVDFHFTVKPYFDVFATPASQTICSNNPITIAISSSNPGATFSWTASGSSLNVGGFSGGTGDTIAQTLFNTGPAVETVTYKVVPAAIGCSGDTVVVTATVDPLPAPIITGSGSVCAGSTVVYSTAAAMTNYSWSVSAGGTITAGGGTGSNTVTVLWNTPGPQTVSVNYINSYGCTAASPVVLPVTVHALPVPTITGTASACLNSTHTYTTEAGQSNYNWIVSAGGIITAGSGTNSITVTWNTTGSQTVTVNYNDVNGCTAPTPTSYNVTVNPLPVPALAGQNAICTGFTATYTTDAGMSNYSWNISAGGSITGGGGANDNTVTVLWTAVGAQTVSVNYFLATGCTAPAPTVLNVTVNPLPVPTITGTNVLCAGTTGVVYTTQAGMTNYLWNISAGGTITAGGGNANNTITVTWNNAGPQTVSVNYNDPNGCTALAPVTYPVTVNALPVPTITGAGAVCLNSTTTYTTEAGQFNYAWTISPGGTITGGLNTNSITVNWNTIGPQTITVNYNDANGCTAPAPTTYNVTVNLLPVPALAGLNAICTGFPVTYTTDAGMSNYLWNVSAGGTITSGGGVNDNTVTVLWTVVGPQSVSVNYTLGTGCTAPAPSVLNVTVNPLPVPSITGSNVLCAGTAGVTYTTQAGMTNYLWSVSAGGTITAGGGTANNTVTVTWNTAGPQTVSVNYTNGNGCTALTPVIFPVTVNALPVPTITGNASVCLNSTHTYTTEAGQSSYAWTVSAGGTITGGNGTSSITVLWNTAGAKTITINYFDANGCTAASPTIFNVTVNTLPIPLLNGLNAVCLNNSEIYTSDPGMSNYSWSVSPGGSITAGGGPGDASATILWSGLGNQTVSVNYFAGTGCTAPTPTVLNVLVKPRPAVTNAGTSAICSGSPISIPLLADLPGTTFTWTATGSSPNVSGYNSGSGPVITDVPVNTGSVTESITYAVTPSLNSCDGAVANFIVNVYPVANVSFNPNGQTFCSGGMTNINLLSNVPTATFTWTATGSSPDVSGFGPGNGTVISQVLSNSGFVSGTVIYHVTPVANGCTGAPNDVTVTLNPTPAVSFNLCTDPVTTTAGQPIKLKGGIPLGGIYAGTGVNTGIFYPALAGPGNHTITYSYSNMFGCGGNASANINVLNPVPFFCNSTLTDVRDNKQYATVQIGAQCWMAQNLDYGNPVASSAMQRDNCIVEKYCFSDNPANCTTYGGLYQWDELMQFTNAAASQGVCPPGWHVPTEAEWNTLFNQYVSNGFAGSALKLTGYSGFNALLDGTRFLNQTWSFSGFATMIWSSTSHGPYKAWAHGMNIYNPSVSYYPAYRDNAFTVRCLKD